MLLECHNCGAPLDVAGAVTSVRCHYCGVTADVKRQRTVAMQTPEGWSPPRQWTPREDSSLPSVPLAYRPQAAVRAIVRWVVFSGFATVGLGGFIAWRVLSAVSDVTGGTSLLAQGALNQAMAAVNAAAESATVGVNLPVVCSGNEFLTIRGKNLVLATGTPVIATGNCTLRVVDSTVSGITAINARNNAKVTVEGGSLTGTGPAVILADNASLDVSNGARLSGEATIMATNNATAQIRDSSVSGRRIAIHMTSNATVDASSSKVEGQIVGAHHTSPSHR